MIKDHLKLVFDKKTPDRTEFPRVKSIDEALKEMFKQPQPVKLSDLMTKEYGGIPTITC